MVNVASESRNATAAASSSRANERTVERTAAFVAAYVGVDFVGEPLARLADLDPDFGAFWSLEPRPDGGPAPAGPVVLAHRAGDRRELVVAFARVVATHLGPPGRPA